MRCKKHVAVLARPDHFDRSTIYVETAKGLSYRLSRPICRGNRRACRLMAQSFKVEHKTCSIMKTALFRVAQSQDVCGSSSWCPRYRTMISPLSHPKTSSTLTHTGPTRPLPQCFLTCFHICSDSAPISLGSSLMWPGLTAVSASGSPSPGERTIECHSRLGNIVRLRCALCRSVAAATSAPLRVLIRLHGFNIQQLTDVYN